MITVISPDNKADEDHFFYSFLSAVKIPVYSRYRIVLRQQKLVRQTIIIHHYPKTSRFCCPSFHS